MIPPNVVALLPTTIDVIERTAGDAPALVAALANALQGAKSPSGATFFRFVNAWVGAGGSRPEGAIAYQAARYWQQQGEIISAYPPEIPVDPRLLRSITGGGDFAAEYGSTLTRVYVTLTDPVTGDTIIKDFWIPDSFSNDLASLYSEAEGKLALLLDKSPIPGHPDAMETMEITYHVGWMGVNR